MRLLGMTRGKQSVEKVFHILREKDQELEQKEDKREVHY